MTECSRRLLQEYKRIQRSPIDQIIIKPSQDNILVWNFVLHSLQDSYASGVYMGRIVFPSNYPFSPPDIIFVTPNGRFETNVKICLSITSYHPESWNPSWTMQSILLGLVSFMHENTTTYGSIKASEKERERLASESIRFNMTQLEFRELFLVEAKGLANPEQLKVIEECLREEPILKPNINHPRRVFRISKDLVVGAIVIGIPLALIILYKTKA